MCVLGRARIDGTHLHVPDRLYIRTSTFMVMSANTQNMVSAKIARSFPKLTGVFVSFSALIYERYMTRERMAGK